MVVRDVEFTAYENQGALLTLGPSQVLRFVDCKDPTTGVLSYNDDFPTDRSWGMAEDATWNGEEASILATGTVYSGLSVSLLGIDLLNLQLSTPVHIAVFNSGGVQYIRYFDPATGADVSQQQLLDGLVTDLVGGLSGLINAPLIGDLVQAILLDPLDYVEQNALLTFNLAGGAPMSTVPCFTGGTLVKTLRGEVPAEKLVIGDRVLTLDNGFQAIRWVGQRKLTPQDFEILPHLRPVRIAAGSLGPGLPERALTVSPQHRCLLRSVIAERMTGRAEVLVAARHLTGASGIGVVEAPDAVTYVHFLCDRHEVVYSDGAPTESFYPGRQALMTLDDRQREEVLELFPELGLLGDRTPPEPARPFLKGRQARQLVQRAAANAKPLLEHLHSALLAEA